MKNNKIKIRIFKYFNGDNNETETKVIDNHIYYYSSVSKKSALELNMKLREVEKINYSKNITIIIIIKNIFIYISIVLVVVSSQHFQ